MSVMFVCVIRMLEYQQQIASLEGDCRDLRSYLQVGDQLTPSHVPDEQLMSSYCPIRLLMPITQQDV